MTAKPHVTTVPVEPGSRLADLLYEYARQKPEADQLAAQLKSMKEAIKLELTTAAPDATRIEAGLPDQAPVRLVWSDRWELDTKRLKAEAPEVYVRYARKGGRWELREGTR